MLKQFHSSNGHIVFPLYGRLFFRVSSASRKGLVHFIDMERSPDWRIASVCSCEAFYYSRQPCRHMRACLEAIAFWAKLPEDLWEEFTERMIFLLMMGHDFMEAIKSDSISFLNKMRKQSEPPKKRQYTLRPNRKLKTT